MLRWCLRLFRLADDCLQALNLLGSLSPLLLDSLKRLVPEGRQNDFLDRQLFLQLG